MFGIKTEKDKRIEHLESLLAMPVSLNPHIEIRRGQAIPYKVRMTIGEGSSIERAKKELTWKLATEIEHRIEYDVSNTSTGELQLTGTIYICEKE